METGNDEIKLVSEGTPTVESPSTAAALIEERLANRWCIDAEVSRLEAELEAAKEVKFSYDMETVMQLSGMSLIEHRNPIYDSSHSYEGNNAPRKGLYLFNIRPERQKDTFYARCDRFDAETRAMYNATPSNPEGIYISYRFDKFFDAVNSGDIEIVETAEAVRRALAEIEPGFIAASSKFAETVRRYESGRNESALPPIPKRATRMKICEYLSNNLVGRIVRHDHTDYGSSSRCYMRVESVDIIPPGRYWRRYPTVELHGTCIFDDREFWVNRIGTNEKIQLDAAVASYHENTGHLVLGNNGLHVVDWPEFDSEVERMRTEYEARHTEFIGKMSRIASGKQD